MTNAPTPAGERQFFGRTVVVFAVVSLLFLCILVVAIGCSRMTKAVSDRAGTLAQPVGDHETGWWDCGLIIKEEEGQWPLQVSFALWLPSDSDDRPAYIRNGIEFIPADHDWDGHRLELRFENSGSQIRADLLDSGELSGKWTTDHRTEGVSMEFRASRFSPDGTYVSPIRKIDDPEYARLFEFPAQNQTWRMDFEESGIAKGSFRLGETTRSFRMFPDHQFPTPDMDLPLHPPGGYSREVSATIETPTGDYRFLHGTFSQFVGSGRPGGVWVSFSTFDGAHAFLFTAEREHYSSEFDGNFYSYNTWHETFVATRLAQGKDVELLNQPDIVSPLNR